MNRTYRVERLLPVGLDLCWRPVPGGSDADGLTLPEAEALALSTRSDGAVRIVIVTTYGNKETP